MIACATQIQSILDYLDEQHEEIKMFRNAVKSISNLINSKQDQLL
jgi:ferritin